ncbi:podocalyxin isoform X5 [Tympanuchus pallidicinctus]|uniref:podocalyxin isoform X5 n=1 Tax=Tympanuchus pallidicinctus TaxID=109042 RepID=UPI00228715E7|nr:podocalyxin isoform X5 [Tympanuchus pallidicinctus]
MAVQVFLPHGTAAWSSSCIQESSVAWQILVSSHPGALHGHHGDLGSTRSSVSSEDSGSTSQMTTVSPKESKQIATAVVTASMVQESSSASRPKIIFTTTAVSSTTAQGTATSKPRGSSAPSIPPSPTTATQRISAASPQENTPPTPASTRSSAQTTKTTDRPDDPSPVSVASTNASQQVGSSASSTAPTAASAAISSATQQKTSPPDNSRTLLTKPSASPNSTQVTSLSSTPVGLASAVSASPHIAGSGSPALDQFNSTVSSSGVSASSLVVKDHGVPSTTSATNQHHLSSTSPVQKSEFTPHSGSVSSTSSKTSLSSPSGTTNKATVTTTVTTPKADPAYTSQGDRSVTHRPGATAQSPTSAPPQAPTLGDQMESKRPDQPHLNVSLQNEVICEDQIQEMWPIINLREAKTCDDWKNASANESFFEFFCSGRRHAFDSKRDRCTVTLASSNPHRWAVHAVVHRLLDPEAVFEELKEKRNELQKLGITNVTYLNQEMEEEIKDQFSTPLIITIVTLAGSLLLVAAIYGCCHQRFSQKKSQRLTEELQTMENGYHDNPTLEVMETGSEMQEKKVNLNGELGDSWIVPLDTIMKEDLEEEEDTHL